MLFHGKWVVCTAFYRSIVGDYHTFNAVDQANTGNDSSAWNIVFIYFPRCQLANFQERRTRVNEPVDAIARQKFTPRHMALGGLFSTTFCYGLEFLFKVIHLRLHMRRVVSKG